MYHPSMTIFAAFDTPQWRTFKLRARKADCVACGKSPSLTADNIQNVEYQVLCRRITPLEIQERVSAKVSLSDYHFE